MILMSQWWTHIVGSVKQNVAVVEIVGFEMMIEFGIIEFYFDNYEFEYDINWIGFNVQWIFSLIFPIILSKLHFDCVIYYFVLTIVKLYVFFHLNLFNGVKLLN